MAGKRLKKGAKGGDVKALQEALNKTKPSPKLKVDGVFGDPLVKALKAFQKKRGLKVDGVAAASTGVALLEAAPSVAQKIAKILGAAPAPKEAAADTGANAGAENGKHKIFKEGYFKRMMRLAKQGEQLNFGFGLSEGDSARTFVLSDEFPARQVWQRIKGELKAKKGGFGVMRLDGTTMLLTVEKRVSGLKKHMKTLAKEQGWKWKTFRLVDLDGNEIADEEEGEGGGATPNAAAPKAQSGRRQLMVKRARVQKARRVWVQARSDARSNIGQVKSALRKAYRKDALQLPLVMAKAKQFDTVLDGLSDDLRKSLDRYLRAPPAAAKEIAKHEKSVRVMVVSFAKAVQKNTLLAAVDEDADLVPGVQVRAPLLQALKGLAAAVS